MATTPQAVARFFVKYFVKYLGLNVLLSIIGILMSCTNLVLCQERTLHPEQENQQRKLCVIACFNVVPCGAVLRVNTDVMGPKSEPVT